ncbi:hypothetical protein Xsze_00277 [Xenorhabdus szentirmaii DSM 16338]|nr:hypothetical protein Xsze_00277 [Xenorhabdus szentirmaii DSM 16338]
MRLDFLQRHASDRCVAIRNPLGIYSIFKYDICFFYRLMLDEVR